jgi:hypothetical protein
VAVREGLGYTSDFDGMLVPGDGNGDGVPVPDIGAFELARDRMMLWVGAAAFK